MLWLLGFKTSMSCFVSYEIPSWDLDVAGFYSPFLNTAALCLQKNGFQSALLSPFFGVAVFALGKHQYRVFLSWNLDVIFSLKTN